MTTSNTGRMPVTTSLVQGILQIRIERPEKKNALTLAMYDLLTEALERAEQDDQVRVIVLQGSSGCFTSGNDLADFAQNPPEGEDSPVFRFLNALRQTGKPLIASVSGLAVGIGTTLLLHCDLVYADKTARFQMPFVNLGLCPEAASSYLLPLRIGHLHAAEMLLLGEMVPVEKAAALGLVNQIFAQAELAEQVQAKAAQLAGQPPQSVRLTKALLKENQAGLVADAMRREAALFLRLLSEPEAREAISAFLEKRPADFSRCS